MIVLLDRVVVRLRGSGGLAWLVLLVLGFLFQLLGTGCKSSEVPASARFASVLIRGNTPGQIAFVLRETFAAHGYSVASADQSPLVFEKKAKGLSNITYGNWGDDIPLFLRVKVRIVPVGEEATFRIECQAYMVRDRGSPTEEEIRFSNLRSRPFQELLDEAAARLRPGSAPPR